MSELQDEKRYQAEQAAQDHKDELIDNFVDDMTADEVEDAIDQYSDCLANIWILHKKDEPKRNQLIIQQIESAMLNKAETIMDEHL